MVLDINLFRKEKGGNPDKIKESERNRFHDERNVDKVIEFDEKWRKCIFRLEEMKKELNAVNKEIGNMKKADKNANVEHLIQKSLKIKEEIPVAQNEEKYLLKERNSYLLKIGNILHSKVVVSDNEDNNKVIKTWGTCKQFDIVENEKEKRQDAVENKEPGAAVGSRTPKKKYYHHFDLLLKIGGANFKKGIQVAGHRGYYLTGMGFLLHNAILQYGLNFLVHRNYTPVYPPFFMRKNIMEACAELSDFDETLYKIPMGNSSGEVKGAVSGVEEENVTKEKKSNTSNKKEGKDLNHQVEEYDRDDFYLIATSEQPLCALHKDENIESKRLPLKYVGFSTCFRKEAGAHGKDIRGVFRVHQFDKIEQFCVSMPHTSNTVQEEMMKTCEEFYQSLNIPYRIVSIVSGALNNAAAIKYDLEGHFPSFNQYRELVSCSNCTDYQSISLNAKYSESSVKLSMQSEKGKKNPSEEKTPNVDAVDEEYENYTKHFQTENKNYVHLLNGTMVAAQRCLCCILENYQNGDGIIVPEKLRPYMNNVEFIPFIE